MGDAGMGCPGDGPTVCVCVCVLLVPAIGVGVCVCTWPCTDGRGMGELDKTCTQEREGKSCIHDLGVSVKSCRHDLGKWMAAAAATTGTVWDCSVGGAGELGVDDM